MPGHVVHIELASRCRGLFPQGDEVTNALYHGALGPDMGMFPGGDLLVSDLAHYVKTADLARALVATAGNDVEHAYAWGWVSHILADSWLHPAINEAAGDIPWSESREPHLRVEFGLDFARLDQSRWLGRVRLHRMKDLGFVQDAFSDTYRLDVDPGRLYRSHRMVTAGQRLLFTLGPRAGKVGALRWLGSLFPDTVLAAATRPIRPGTTLREGLALCLEELPRRLETLLGGELAQMENVNLDNGRPLEGSDPETARVLRMLEQRLGV